MRTEMLKGPDREPETRTWIDDVPRNGTSVLWDVGANVGSFSVYAAKRGINVVAVEPVPSNLYLLVKNISLNKVQDACIVLPVPLTDVIGLETFALSSFQFGAARHRFRKDRSFRGTELNDDITFRLTGCTLDWAVKQMNLPVPTHIKVDVDGIDDKVLYGAQECLESVVGICCEMRFSDDRVKGLIEFLKARGLRFTHRTVRNGFFVRA